MSLKYIITNDLSEEKRESAIIFSDNVLHYMFKNLNPISSGLFCLYDSFNIQITGGSFTLKQEPRYCYDEVLILETLKNAKYFIFIFGDLDLKSAIIFNKDYVFDFSSLNWLKPISEGDYDYELKIIKKGLNNNFISEKDNIIINQTLKYGVCLV
ncbi:MAG: hypothetical protein QMB51_02610 [Patescibacteria group bacterium]